MGSTSAWCKEPMVQTDDQQSARHPRKCTARSSRTKQPCERWAMKGQAVCMMHGGKAPQALAPLYREEIGVLARRRRSVSPDDTNLNGRNLLGDQRSHKITRKRRVARTGKDPRIAHPDAGQATVRPRCRLALLHDITRGTFSRGGVGPRLKDEQGRTGWGKCQEVRARSRR